MSNRFFLHLIIRLGTGIGWACASAQPTLSSQPITVSPAVIPRPVAWQASSGSFTLSKKTTVQARPPVAEQTVLFAHQLLAQAIGSGNPVIQHEAAVTLQLRIDSLEIPQREGYRLLITPTRITVTGHDQAGVFYGLQSLSQLAQQSVSAGYRIPAGQIEDHPRFSYRGLHLDVSRHLFPVSFIRKYIDLMALYKLNTFHWHLTDDQGWRIEIKRYPALQQKAAYRTETMIGHKKELPHRFDGKRYGGYYTQDEIRSVVQYAADRHITVIPEIEMPGHALAALSAFPALGCARADDSPGGPYQAATFWGVFDDVFCAGNDSTFVFLQHVLDEVIGLFPSTYIHVGGDECPKTRWKTCPNCQARIRAEQLTDEKELQSYFIRRIERHLNSRGRQLIGWDEILEGDSPAVRLSPTATVMSWQGIAGGIEAARQKRHAVMTPESHVYFDYYQSLCADEPVAAAGYTPLQKVYAYEPVPTELSADEATYIKGVQGNLWSEYTPRPEQAERMVFPRALAVAEIAWTSQPNRNYPDFLRRLRLHKPMLNRWPVNYADVFDEPTDSVTVNADGTVALSLSTTRPGAAIRYTTNGTDPTGKSAVYGQPIVLSRSGTVKATVYEGTNQQGRIWQKTITLSKATGKPVRFSTPPMGGYKPTRERVAVNGVLGTARYNTGEWFGFQGVDLEATIDLQTTQTVSGIATNVLNYHWQRMWAPVVLRFAVSEDGKTFREVYEQRQFPVNGINPVDARFPPVSARYVRIQAVNRGTIPPGEYGAGGKAWLLLDEFIVR